MAEYSANAIQIVAPGETVIFTESPSPCDRGFIRHRNGSGNFLLSGWTPNSTCKCKKRNADYFVDFGANISVPTGSTPGEISLAITLDGSAIPTSTMTVVPAAVEEPFNISRAINVDVWSGCCQSLTVRNISTIPVQVENANIVFTRPDLAITR